MSKIAKAVLLIIDVQRAIDAAYHASEGPRNNPDAERKMGQLLATWRQRHRPIIHIRHDSTFPTSAYRPGQMGNEFKDEVAPLEGETIVAKRTNSAFIGALAALVSNVKAGGRKRLIGRLCTPGKTRVSMLVDQALRWI